mmetsp:Transcript_42384/g.116923  ORF Transcript_42384/g.116923 Transcript_42384/m.116923 type:complete len:282 (-) Transcript_42384:1009-1854(-)
MSPMSACSRETSSVRSSVSAVSLCKRSSRRTTACMSGAGRRTGEPRAPPGELAHKGSAEESSPPVLSNLPKSCPAHSFTERSVDSCDSAEVARASRSSSTAEESSPPLPALSSSSTLRRHSLNSLFSSWPCSSTLLRPPLGPSPWPTNSANTPGRHFTVSKSLTPSGSRAQTLVTPRASESSVLTEFTPGASESASGCDNTTGASTWSPWLAPGPSSLEKPATCTCAGMACKQCRCGCAWQVLAGVVLPLGGAVLPVEDAVQPLRSATPAPSSTDTAAGCN